MRVCVRVFSVGFGPGLDSMSPARSRRSASHATAGFPKKLGGRASGEAGCRWIQFAQCSPGQCPRLWHTNHEQAVSVWCPDVSLASASLITSCSWQTLLQPVATVLLMLCSAVFVECLVLNPCCVVMFGMFCVM